MCILILALNQINDHSMMFIFFQINDNDFLDISATVTLTLSDVFP